MINKLSDINKIEEIKLPAPSSLNQFSDEEQIYTEAPSESQNDHKSVEALKLVQEKAREENNKLKIDNQNLKDLATHRIKYSKWILGFVILFVSTVLIILILSGYKILIFNDNVIDVLLATNTVQVVGVLYIVAKWLYPQK